MLVAATSASPPLRILIVEDQDTFADFLDSLLARSGLFATTSHAATLQAAVSALQAASYDVVLLDLKLPDSTDGLATIDAVMDASLVPPVVVLTGGASEAQRYAAYERGVQEYSDKSELAAGGAARLRELIQRAVHRDRGFGKRHLALARAIAEGGGREGSERTGEGGEGGAPRG